MPQPYAGVTKTQDPTKQSPACHTVILRRRYSSRDVANSAFFGRRAAPRMTVILLKVVIALFSGLLGAGVLRSRVMDLPEGSFLRWALGLQLVPSVALFLVLYMLGHQDPTSDVPSYYLPAARAALAGQIPFRDFVSSYAPLFPYVGAALVAVWDSGKIFALFAMLLNAATLVLWHRSASVCSEPRTLRMSTVLFASCGHVIVQGLLGTNQCWIAAAVAASTLLILRERVAAAGFVQAAAACTTKLLAHLFWPVFWICTPHRARWLAAAAIPTTAVYLLFIGIGAGPNLLHPLRFEATQLSSGNLPYLLDLFLGSLTSERLILDGLTATALAVALGWLYWNTRAVAARDRPTLLPAALMLIALTLMIFSKKSFTGYVMFVMYPLVLLLVTGRTRARVGFLLGFNVLLVAEPSLWFRLNGFNGSLRDWLDSGPTPVIAAFVGLDLVLVGCYVYLAWLSVRSLQATVDGAIADRKASQSATACSLV
jgi:hypothetical protein